MRGSLKQRIVELFGKSLDHQLIPIGTETTIVKLSGFVGLPENARRRGALQYFFVNGRNMRHPYFHKAVMQCYEQLIPTELQPNYFINFEVDPETIDVNIHPTKNEIKFENEQPIWQILVAAIKESLGKFNAVPSINFDADDAPEIPAFTPDSTATHDIVLDLSYNPFKDSNKSTTTPSRINNTTQWQGKQSGLNAATRDWDKLYTQFEQDTQPVIPDNRLLYSEPQPSALNSQQTISIEETASAVMQLKNRYILSPAKSGLMIIDQHRAHVRILYDRYFSLADSGTLNSQRIIFPEVLQLTAAQNVVLDSIIDDIILLGFDLSYLGDNSWAINGIPSAIGEVNTSDMILKMIESITDSGEELKSSLKEKIALSMANAAAIKSGQSLTQQEMETIISDLFKLPTPNYTPDGKTVVSIISIDDIVSLF